MKNKIITISLIIATILAMLLQAFLFEFGIISYTISLIIQIGLFVFALVFVIKKSRWFIITLVICVVLVVPNFMVLFNFDKTSFEYVLHASGNIDGHNYLNSVQSLNYYIEKDVNLVELDFLFTKDEEIICSHQLEYFNNHSVDNRPTLEEAKNTKLLGKYDVITFDYLLSTLKTNQNLKIVFDTKEKDSKSIINKMIEKANLVNFDILNRFIIQVYSIDNYEELQTFNFKEYWFTNYKSYYTPSKIIKLFEDKSNVTTYVMPPFLWHIFVTSQVKTTKDIAIHTVNNPLALKFLANRGVDYIYVDYF